MFREKVFSHLLVDISNSFTKICRTDGETLSPVERLATAGLLEGEIARLIKGAGEVSDITICSVVPDKTCEVRAAFDGVPAHEVGADPEALGIGIRYPNPAEIGQDRLANAVACHHFFGSPAIVVDFGTAVTFDVLSVSGEYIGGVIAPGLGSMTSYLHEKTALLPKVSLEEPPSAVGKSTRGAILAGAVHGYRGLIREILAQIVEENFCGLSVPVVATGGDAVLIGKKMPLFDAVDPLLTLHGLRLLAKKHFLPA